MPAIWLDKGFVDWALYCETADYAAAVKLVFIAAPSVPYTRPTLCDGGSPRDSNPPGWWPWFPEDRRPLCHFVRGWPCLQVATIDRSPPTFVLSPRQTREQGLRMGGDY
ncbi:hypothetical protein BaRGS_00033962 [Batillaria attramentaria]|uniref:Uncharacterized protein n=1 Tax=Batillaria attramentaria TaxID=370345 RepID=A0ABD0JJD5_9CAEN